jgi:hypothetical protein
MYVSADMQYKVRILWYVVSQVLAKDKVAIGEIPKIRRKSKTNGLTILSKQPTASFSMYANGCLLYRWIS